MRYSGTTVTITPRTVGTATITVTSAATKNYKSASKTYTITINAPVDTTTNKNDAVIETSVVNEEESEITVTNVESDEIELTEIQERGVSAFINACKDIDPSAEIRTQKASQNVFYDCRFGNKDLCTDDTKQQIIKTAACGDEKIKLIISNMCSSGYLFLSTGSISDLSTDDEEYRRMCDPNYRPSPTQTNTSSDPVVTNVDCDYPLQYSQKLWDMAKHGEDSVPGDEQDNKPTPKEQAAINRVAQRCRQLNGTWQPQEYHFDEYYARERTNFEGCINDDGNCNDECYACYEQKYNEYRDKLHSAGLCGIITVYKCVFSTPDPTFNRCAKFNNVTGDYQIVNPGQQDMSTIERYIENQKIGAMDLAVEQAEKMPAYQFDACKFVVTYHKD